MIRPVNCFQPWVGVGDDRDVEHDRTADLSTARDPCDPGRDPALKIRDPCDPLLIQKTELNNFLF